MINNNTGQKRMRNLRYTKVHGLLSLAYVFLACCMLGLQSCRDGDTVIYSTKEDTGTKAEQGDIAGMYLLNEGNMGSNKATLDYLDLSGTESLNAMYHRNIYSERNPNEIKELGDVGNDIKVYGSKLWMVINCSNKVEVANAYTCTKEGKIDIPNCRYVAFDGGYAYVSAYVAPVAIRPDAEVGAVYKVDTLTLKVVDKIPVGYQPEEMAVLNGKLYVANSGGYRVPNYDKTVSVIDLKTFTEDRKMDVAINLHRLRADKYGQVWVSSRGNYKDVPSRLYWLEPDNTGTMRQGGEVDVPISDMCIVGDSLYYIGVQWSNVSQSNTIEYGILDVRTHQVLTHSLSSAPEIQSIEMPYGIIVNPQKKDFYLMDAKNYVSSGELLHFKADGSFDWRVWTGDIPAHAAFVYRKPQIPSEPSKPVEEYSKYILAVDEYVPAPGQFVNTMPKYEEGDDAASMAAKCTQAIGGNRNGMISLGAYGGYVTFHFDHSVANVKGEKDLYIKGNAFSSAAYPDKFGGSSEPGVVMVSQDVNGNGKPDDPWYELSGSADVDSVCKVVYGYEIAYTKAAMQDVPWTDNRNKNGVVNRNMFHAQEYFPLWLPSPLKFQGTLLPPNGENLGDDANPYWFQYALRYGYVDNVGNGDIDACSFDIGWAVEPVTRKPVYLDHIDFVRVYCAQNQVCSWLGETSTEVSGAEDLHLYKSISANRK